MKQIFYISLIIFNVVFSAEKQELINNNYESSVFLNRGDIQNSPNLDRAKGYLLKGEVKAAVSNYGQFIGWGFQPNGLWGQYSYIPDLSFVAGVPGHAYSSDWSTNSEDAWEKITLTNSVALGEEFIEVWVAEQTIYSAWKNADGTDNFIGIVYNTIDDRGEIAIKRSSYKDFDLFSGPQWAIDDSEQKIYLYLENNNLNPNYASSRIGLAYPWSIRPAFKERTVNADGYYLDQYDYGSDHLPWSSDDAYVYYGATFAESNLTRDNGYKLTDWQPSYDSRYNTHNLDHNAGEYFGNTTFTDNNDPYALLAHSTMPETWPKKYSFDSGSEEPFWPGGWADGYFGDTPELWGEVSIYDCQDGRSDPGCWRPVAGNHISDMDVFVEFDDRWAHLGNQVKENEYQQTGYPMGLKVSSMAHSYGVAYAEDILFVTVKVRNESGDFTAFEKDKDENIVWVRDVEGNIITGSAMEMPDGTAINRGDGFDYKKLYLGFYMDADVLSHDINGSIYPHTNPDDFMKYIDCKVSKEYFPDGCEEINGDTLRISMAVIGDWDGESSAGIEGFSMQTGESIGPDFGLVAIQLLDSPYATSPIDMDLDGYFDIFPGEKLKMTDWHWFDWYNRPGVVAREGDQNCCAGDPGRSQAKNKEEIQYKVISGDNTNLTDGTTSGSNEKAWFFHSSDPTDPTEAGLNPHFDDVDALDESAAFLGEPEPGGGLDAVLEMSSGPFDLEVGEQVSFSFGLVFGQNYDDLLKNAKFGQIMYNSHYQGYTAPKTPNVMAKTYHNKIEIFWDDISVYDKDVVTGYSDFEGFKIYRSMDGGITWGDVDQEIIIRGVKEGWEPYAQFDLDSLSDVTWCILGWENGECIKHDKCSDPCIRGTEVFGPDSLAPWFNLGENVGFDGLLLDINNPDSVIVNVNSNSGDTIVYKYKFTDTNVSDGLEYTYSVVAYDTGVMAEVVTFIDTTGQESIVQEGLTKKIVSIPDPEGWGKINPYQSLESPKGSTIHESNFITAIPGYVPRANLDSIKVVPNPYIVNSHFNETIYKKRIRFTQLPEKCTITIYTVTGEKVREIKHESISDGNEWWDLRSYNNQEVAPGLYIYVIEADNAKKIDKFAIIR